MLNGDFMATGQGVIEIDFGGGNGSNEANVSVSAPAIVSTQAAEAFIMYEASTDYSVNDQAYLATLIRLTCSVPTNGVGFTIHARSLEKIKGKVKVRNVWA